MTWSIKKIILASVIGIIVVGLSIANEKRRYVIILQNESIATKAEKELQDLRRLGFLDRDIPVQSTYEQLQAANKSLNMARNKWWMISVKIEENKGKQIKLKRLLSLNRKILKSYKQDLNDLRRFGFPENDPQVVFSRRRVAETVVELAHLTREYNNVVNKKDFLTADQATMVCQMIELNQKAINSYKKEIEEYFEQGFNTNDRKVQGIRSKLAMKMAEKSFLERKLHQ